jgi:DNA primase
MKKAIRTNKVFVDWSQNDEHKTTISIYSLRAPERPTVSTPVTWDEVERTLKKNDASLLVFESHQVLERVEKNGDLFARLLTLKQKLPKLGGIAKGDAKAIATGLDIAAQADRPAARKPQKSLRRTATRPRRQKV